MKRGEIWAAVWPNDPTKKERPVLIVSNDFRNSTPALQDVTVLKITSFKRADGSKKVVNRFEDVVVQLKKESIIQGGAIFSIEKRLLRRSLGQLAPSQMTEVDDRLRSALAL
jgi:mRNA-degrading endonuclease toxin of MazEF toxin-antitoxin module